MSTLTFTHWEQLREMVIADAASNLRFLEGSKHRVTDTERQAYLAGAQRARQTVLNFLSLHGLIEIQLTRK